jgi:molecular chaperone HscB
MLDFSKDCFTLFGLPRAYPIDRSLLDARYREAQRITHPDRYAQQDDQTRRLAVQGAARVNEAYETLKDPMQRARYLLGLLGVQMAEQGETTQDTAFLMEQLEMREELEEARQQPDPFTVTAALATRIGAAIQALVARMALQFEAGTPEQLAQAREIVRKLQFLQKLAREVERVEMELEQAL